MIKWFLSFNLRLLLLAVCARASTQDVVPAGSIEEALVAENLSKYVVLFEDNPAIEEYVKALHGRFFPAAQLIDQKQTAAKPMAECSLIFFGTPAQPWLHKHRDVLPFRFQGDSVVIDGRQFEGKHLRVICAMRNPENPKHRALVFAAAKQEDVLGIDAAFDKRPEWIVADDKQTLGAGSFHNIRLVAADMRADLEELVARIKSVHPATTNGIPPDLAEAIRTARGELSTPLSRAQFGLVLNRVLHSLHDGHSNVKPLVPVEVLAMPFTWIGEGMIVTADAGGLRKGDHLLRIGTRTDAEILELLRGVIPSENDHFVRNNAEHLLRDVDFLRSIGIAEKAPVAVTVERAGKERKLAVPLTDKPDPGGNLPWVRFELDQGNDLGVFVVDNCANDDFYKETLKQFFDGVREKKIGRIAVDVRRNGGGNSQVIDEFLRYVDVEHYTGCGSVIRWSDDAKTQMGEMAKPAGFIEHFPQVRHANARVTDPFGGRVFVLTSKATFSSGNWFALILQDNKLAQVLGEPTGNAPTSYGDALPFQLTHSALSYQLSFKRWLRPDPERDPADCLTPDLIVAMTRRHIIEGIDPVLEHLRKVR